MLHSRSIQMQKIFDEQIVGKLKEDRELLMNAGPSDWNIERLTADAYPTSVDELRSRQKQMLGGNIFQKSYCHFVQIYFAAQK